MVQVVRLYPGQDRFLGTEKQACKKASLKKAKEIEAHHGLGIQVGNVLHSHDWLLSAAASAARCC